MKLTKRGKFAVLVMSGVLSLSLGQTWANSLTQTHKEVRLHCKQLAEDSAAHVKLVRYEVDGHTTYITYQCERSF